MPATYSPDALYHDLRSGLVHSYSTEATYAFTDLGRAGKHLHRVKTAFGERTLINLEDFVQDLELAYEEFRSAVATDDQQFELARERLQSLGLLAVG